MAGAEILGGVAAIIGSVGGLVGAVALLRNGSDEDKELDRLIKRRMKLQMLKELEEPGDHSDPLGKVSLFIRPFRLLWIYSQLALSDIRGVIW